MYSESIFVSIIIPVFNVEKYISRCLKSVLSQSYKNFEIILVDDGSTDSSLKVCTEIANTDQRIHFYHKENGGLSSARNYGMERAIGDFIVFIDSDDMVHPFFLERMIFLQKKYHVQIVSCLFKSFSTESDLTISYSKVIEKKYDGKSACYALFEPDTNYENMLLTAAWGKLIDKKIAKSNLFPVGRNHEDVATIFKYFYYASSVLATTEELYFYFNNNTGITKNPSSKTLIDDLWARQYRALFFKNHKEKKLYDLALNNFGGVLLHYIKNKLLPRDEIKVFYRDFQHFSLFHSILRLKLFIFYHFF